MSENCCHDHSHDLKFDPNNIAFKRVLWLALILNLSMFFIEVFFGVLSQSLALRADAIDFLGDALNYFVTLFLIDKSLKAKSTVSITKAIFMLTFAFWVLGEAIYRFFQDELPDAFTMSWVGGLALAVNAVVAFMLFKYKDGDSNMQSVWLCSRNDALGNLAIIIASAGVYWWGTKWPDLIVALVMATLAVTAAIQILKLAFNERKTAEPIFKKKKEHQCNSHHDHHH
jgi:cation diffusion facilitator family transporter